LTFSYLQNSITYILSITILKVKLFFYPHFVNPQLWQTAQPLSCSTAPPHSGHAPISMMSEESLCPLPLPLFPPVLCFSIAIAIASAHERICPPLCHAGWWQRTPLS
jgi:hypothetical protein